MGLNVTEQNKRQELSEAVEDAVGFNFRSLRTLWDLIARPNRVFAAYAARDRATYTPALRIWLGLIGLQVFISAIWGGWEGVMRRQYDTGSPAVRAVYEQVSSGRTDEYFRHYGDAMGVAHPLLVGGMTALSVFVLSWFRKGLPWPARLNIAMGVLAAGSVVGLILMPLVVMPQFFQYSWAPSLAIVLAYFLTFLRGAPGVLADTAFGAWIKAFVYALVLILLVVIGGVLMAVISTFYAVYQLNASPAA